MRNNTKTTPVTVSIPNEPLAQVDAAKFNKTRSKFAADVLTAHFRRRRDLRQNQVADEAARSLLVATPENG